ncbi:MAG: hypothetical protein RLY88_995 [Actinomycetota bacterium]|jgi:MFS family permease
MKKRSATLVMVSGAFAYLVAVTNRSSMGIATLAASERFDVTAAALSTLAVVQLIAYAGLQIPVGILLDRFGARKLLIVGALLMSAGQLIVAFSESLTPAVIGRLLVGAGDAFVFISMIRLINGWYVGKQATRMQGLLTNVGQLGQAVSAIPFAFVLVHLGWSMSFGWLAVITLILVFVSFTLVVDDREAHHSASRPETIKHAVKLLFENIRLPGVRLAFWTHFSLQSAPSVFLLLWGYPFLVQGQGFSPANASLLLSLFTVIGFFVSPQIAKFAHKHPHRRSDLVYMFMLLIALAWGLVVAMPGRAPFWMIILLVVVLASSGPASMIAFDYSKSFVDKNRLGTANGFINVGGFSATFTMMFFAGLILDAYKSYQASVGNTVSLYSLDGFRWAMSVEFLALLIGVTFFSIERRKTRKKKADEEGIILKPLHVLARERLSAKRPK